MNCVRMLRWQHLIIGSLTVPRFKFNAYYTEQDQFVRYINTSINEVLRSSRKSLPHLLSFKPFNAHDKREGPLIYQSHYFMTHLCA